MPYYPLDEGTGHKYEIETYWDHVIAKYSNLSILEVQELDYIDYLLLRRDAFIYKMNQTEKGREYLDNAYYLEQTKPDRQSLRDQFGKEG